MMIRSAAVALASAVVLAAGVGVAVVSSQQPKTAAGKPSVAVFKSPTCGCCAKWNEHMTAAGYTITSRDMTDMNAVKDEHRVPSPLRSCHTALVAGYVIEGHVPAAAIRKLLAERPHARGLAVPGMPVGSPGMEVEGQPAERYAVVIFGPQGQRIYVRFHGKELLPGN